MTIPQRRVSVVASSVAEQLSSTRGTAETISSKPTSPAINQPASQQPPTRKRLHHRADVGGGQMGHGTHSSLCQGGQEGGVCDASHGGGTRHRGHTLQLREEG